MGSDDDTIVLDNALTSESVDIARHMSRKMLHEAIDALHEIVVDKERKDQDRIQAAKALIDFAQGSKESAKRLTTQDKLPANIRKKLAKMGYNDQQKKLNPGNEQVLPDEEEKERVGHRNNSGKGGEGADS